jgi:uncharacterized membrane protein YdbT with pleckstrin-like domain
MPPADVNPPAQPLAHAQPHYCQGILLDADEEVVTVVHKSIIGVVAIILVGLAAIIATLVVLVTLLPGVFTTSPNQASNIFVALALVTLVALTVLIAIYIYLQNRLILTTKNLIQILQKTLFNRKVSRLSMSNVEDVSAEQRGFFATVFNYGTLLVQTAGEMENFIFTLCPNPNKFAQQILEAREAYAESLDQAGRVEDTAAALPPHNT